METNEANQLNFRLLTPKLEPPSLLLRFPIKLYRCVIRLWVIITSLTDRDIPIYIKSVVQYCRSPSMEISKYRCNHIMYRGDTLSRLGNCCMPLISWTRKIIQKKKMMHHLLPTWRTEQATKGGWMGAANSILKNRRAYAPITPDALQNGEYQHRVAQNGYRR